MIEERFEGLKELEKFFTLYADKCEEETPLKAFVKNQLEHILNLNLNLNVDCRMVLRSPETSRNLSTLHE